MTRWLLIPLGLLIAAGALWVLAGGGPGTAPPLDHVDAADRARLEAVLRDAEGASATP